MQLYFWDRYQGKGEENHKRIENGNRQPHIAQSFWKNTGLFFLNKICRTFKSGYTEHGSGKTPENSHGYRTMWDGLVVVSYEDIQAMLGKVNANS